MIFILIFIKIFKTIQRFRTLLHFIKYDNVCLAKSVLLKSIDNLSIITLDLNDFQNIV